MDNPMKDSDTKQNNPSNPYPEVTKRIEEDIYAVSQKPIKNFRIIRAKSGVYLYKCLYDGKAAAVKYFEKEEDRREILNYRILVRHAIPTIRTFALGDAAIVM